MSVALTNAKLALAELRKTTLGYKKAQQENPELFAQTHSGRCEAALQAIIAELSPAPAKTVQLPKTFTPDHETSGLPGYPAIDVFAAAGSVALCPAAGTIDKISGHPVTPTTRPGGPYGLSCYVKKPGTGKGRYYLTHFATLSVKVGDKVSEGDPLGTVANYSKATNGVTPSHIHEGYDPTG